MNTLVHKIGEAIPESTAKDWLRRLVFPILFTARGTRTVQIGPPDDKVAVRITHFPLFQERLGEREIEGYLKHYPPQPGHVVINAGGYHGYFALYLAHKVGPTGHVYCFEPDKINAAIIRKNITLNNRQNITVIPKGLWNASAAMPFETRGSSSRRSSSGKAAAQALFCRLDDELEKRGVRHVDFISMDIEGAEIEAIEGAHKIIRNSPGISLAIASYHIVDGTRTAERVEEQLKTLGLKAETGFPRHLTTYGFTQ